MKNLKNFFNSKKNIFIIIIILFISIVIITVTRKYIVKDFHFIELPTMITPRSQHTAITLNDGRVLIVGNVDYFLYETQGTNNQADMYNPITKKFSKIGKTNHFYSNNQTALNLSDGKVLLIEGYKLKMEIFNPMTLKFIEVKNIIPISKNAVLLKNGNVLFSNGRKIEVYNVNNWKIVNTAKLLKQRNGFQNIKLDNGEVLFLGGRDNKDYVSEIESYNPINNSLRIVGNLKISRFNPICLLLKNGDIFIAGGIGKINKLKEGYLNNCEIYNPPTNKTLLIRKLIKERGDDSDFKAILLKDGSVLLYGGGKNYTSEENSCGEIYNPEKNEFSLLKGSVIDRKNYQLNLLHDGNILITGGTAVDPNLELSDTINPLSLVELIDVNYK